MASPGETRVSGIVYSADPHLKNTIFNLLKQHEFPTIDFFTADSLSSPPNLESPTVVIVAIPGAAASARGCCPVAFQESLNLVARLRKKHPCSQFILISAPTLSLQQAVQAIQHQITALLNYQDNDFAFHLYEHITASCRRCLELKKQGQNPLQPRGIQPPDLVGSSQSFIRVIKQAQRAALVSDAPVIINGESGTGKQRIAEIIHQLDEKRNRFPFICVNCAAITPTLAESELFGHCKGAFTGATESRLGYFRTADKGTILLDEISELPLNLQPKILRVLQEGLVLPVGSDRELNVDVRIIAAANRDLEPLIEKNSFRLDLFQRLNVIRLDIPPLRQRIEDIPVLFEAFLKKYADYYPSKINSVNPQVYEILAQTIGSGNIRELENIVRQTLVFKEYGSRIEITDLPQNQITSSLGRHFPEHQIDIPNHLLDALYDGRRKLADTLDEFERCMLEHLVKRPLAQNDLARRLGVTRKTLYNKLRKYNLLA